MRRELAAGALWVVVLAVVYPAVVAAQTRSGSTIIIIYSGESGEQPSQAVQLEEDDLDEGDDAEEVLGEIEEEVVVEEAEEDAEVEEEVAKGGEKEPPAAVEAQQPKASVPSQRTTAEVPSTRPPATPFMGQWRPPEARTAPREYQAAANISFPSWEELNAGMRKAWEKASSGDTGMGTVHCWSGDKCRWQRPDGSTFQTWPSGYRRLETKEYSLEYFSGASCSSCRELLKLTFPDGTKLSRRRHERRDYVWFIYEDESRGLVFDLHQDGYWTKHLREDPPYVFYFGDRWSLYLEAFAEWKGRKDFFDYAREAFGFENTKIPAVLHDTAEGMQDFSEESPGYGYQGNANQYRLTLHGAKLPLESDAREPWLRDWLKKKQSFEDLLHETAHNLQRKRCAELRPKNDRDGGELPVWFKEGFAEFMAMRFMPGERAHNYEYLLRALKRHTAPSLSGLNYSNNAALYPLGGVMVDYLVREYGDGRVRAYHDEVCAGAPADEVFQRKFDRSPDQAYEEMLQHFSKRREELRADIEKWSLEALPQLGYAEGAHPEERVDASLALLANPRALAAIPDIQSAYLLDVGKLKGKYEGPFRGPRGEKGYLWKSGEYLLQGAAWKVYVNTVKGYTTFTTKGHELTQWRNGQKRWDFPNGSRTEPEPSRAVSKSTRARTRKAVSSTR